MLPKVTQLVGGGCSVLPLADVGPVWRCPGKRRTCKVRAVREGFLWEEVWLVGV